MTFVILLTMLLFMNIGIMLFTKQVWLKCFNAFNIGIFIIQILFFIFPSATIHARWNYLESLKTNAQHAQHETSQE